MVERTTSSVLVEALHAGLSPLGFRRRGPNVYRAGAEVYSMVNVQRSGCGSTLYVNFGFSPPSKARSGWLAESGCSVRFRAESVREIEVEALRLLEEGIDPPVLSGIVDPTISVLTAASSVDGLREVLKDRVTAQRWVSWPELLS